MFSCMIFISSDLGKFLIKTCQPDCFIWQLCFIQRHDPEQHYGLISIGFVVKEDQAASPEVRILVILFYFGLFDNIMQVKMNYQEIAFCHLLCSSFLILVEQRYVKCGVLWGTKLFNGMLSTVFEGKILSRAIVVYLKG